MARTSTLNVSLTPTLEGFVRRKVTSGSYESASEVVREGLRMLRDRERLQRSFWSDVREKVGVARRQVAAGLVVDGDIAMDEILSELDGGRKSRTGRKGSR